MGTMEYIQLINPKPYQDMSFQIKILNSINNCVQDTYPGLRKNY